MKLLKEKGKEEVTRVTLAWSKIKKKNKKKGKKEEHLNYTAAEAAGDM